MCLVPDNRQITNTESPQTYHPSTFSTTSGLGSNFTTNTISPLSTSLGNNTQPPTPSPRRKYSGAYITDNIDYSDPVEENPFVENHGAVYMPNDYLTRYPSNDGFAGYRGGVFGKLKFVLYLNFVFNYDQF